MDSHAEHAAAFARDLTDFVNRIAAKKIVVTSFDADWSCFGSWSVTAQTEKAVKLLFSGTRYTKPYNQIGQEVFRISWDGRDRIVTIASAITTTPGGWGEGKPERSA